MQTARWRLIVDPQPAPGPWNMAVDEAIFERMDSGSIPPTLRLYAWTPPCLSLGQAQPVSEVDFSSLTLHGWDLVRRPTGGRAILHADEITYSVIGLVNDPRLEGSVLKSYCRLAQALLRALEILGLKVFMEESGSIPDKQPSPVCFEVPSSYEIMVDGKKILGSAQARRRNGLLQHGSLPLTGDLTRITQCLLFKEETDRQKAVERLLQHAATVEMITGKQISWNQAAQAFIEGFEEKLDIELIPGILSPDELTQAEKLYKEKYKSDHWISHF
jgi:lipoyl(octanoyl) transferase